MKRKAIKRQRERKTKKSQCKGRLTDQSLTKHHIVPKSRGGSDVTPIRWGDHKAYHNLFGNMTPEEILQYLVGYFWGGDNQYIIDFYNKHIKGGVK